MMVNYCAVPLCTNSSYKKGISFHRFPANEMKRRAWIIRIRRSEIPCSKVSRHMSVCSAHFTESDFKILKSGRKFLKDEAEPSVFPFPSTSKQTPLCLIPTKRPKKVKIKKTEGFTRWCLPRKKKTVSSAAKPVKKVDAKPVILEKSLHEIALINNATVSTVSLGNKMAAIVCPTSETSENTSNNVPVTNAPTKVMLKFVPDLSTGKNNSYIPVFYILPQNSQEN